jgi:hypothetical protein
MTATTVATPLYEQIMGESWHALAAPVRRLHAAAVRRARGRFEISSGASVVSRLVAAICRLPRSADAADTRLAVTCRHGLERWERTFDGRRVRTWQRQSRRGLLCERFGMVAFDFTLEAADGCLIYRQRDAAMILGPARLRIPRGLAPRIDARECPAGSARVEVDVRVTLPRAGLLIAYRGSIETEDLRP